MFEITRYTADQKSIWDDFVMRSKQGTFLLRRDYMDYHRDRFQDHSLMVWNKKSLIAMLPANQEEDVLWSHQGLTYGGLLTLDKTKAAEVCDIFRHINDYLRAHNFHRVVYKPIPWIYHQLPAEEDLYAVFNVCQARLAVRNIASVVCQTNAPKWSRDRHYGANKAHTHGIEVEQCDTDYAPFWKVLTDNLKTTHHATPVHTLEEMQRLHAAFPDNIKLYTAKLGGDVLGGVLLYVTPHVVHSQYISATAEGKHKHAVDAIFRTILTLDYKYCKYFDFGTSNEQQGRILNEGLIYQKEGFGGRGVCYDWYEWDL
ncbi:MAG: GNAT family N-acetyltransferase [Prevotella sp.]|jgi:hypothetical protein